MTTNQPIYSSKRGESPEMDELIKEFLERLNQYRSEIHELLTARNWEKLKPAVHRLKGLGGGYGYDKLSELARESDAQIKNKNDQGIVETTSAVIDYIDRIIASGF